MLKILIAGGTGLIGNRIIESLKDKYEIHVLSRNKKENKNGIIYHTWNPDENSIDENSLKVDVIINLAGAGIADKRWTKERKKILIDSRVVPTNLLIDTLKKSKHKPSLYIGASAIGFYGDRGNEVLNEEAKVGSGFLAECSEVWEEASMGMKPFVDRMMILRIGIVLSSKGGALPELKKTSPLGVLGYFGDMYYSWIHIDDIVHIIDQAIINENYSGIINGVSPTPIKNKDLILKLAEVLRGKISLPAPSFGIKLALGEMSAVVLNSTKVVPKKLQSISHNFLHPDLEKALKDILAKGV